MRRKREMDRKRESNEDDDGFDVRRRVPFPIMQKIKGGEKNNTDHHRGKQRIV